MIGYVLRALVVLAALAVLQCGCGGGGTPEVTPAEARWDQARWDEADWGP